MKVAKKPCPLCRKPVAPAAKWAPFCSERCRTQDLANWATGEYAIPAPATEADEIWDLPYGPDTGERGSDA